MDDIDSTIEAWIEVVACAEVIRRVGLPEIRRLEQREAARLRQRRKRMTAPTTTTDDTPSAA